MASDIAASGSETTWRECGSWAPTLATKAGLPGETKAFFAAWGHLGDAAAARRALLEVDLPQRSRATRRTIVGTIQRRFVRWGPPPWVVDDLVAFSLQQGDERLSPALLLHAARHDNLIYRLVQDVLYPRWSGGELSIARADVLTFLDASESEHPEVGRWSHETRAKVAGNALTLLRDYGLLRGRAVKRIVEPVVPVDVARHLVRLLEAEGVARREIATHPDWHLWLWDASRVRREGIVVGIEGDNDA